MDETTIQGHRGGSSKLEASGTLQMNQESQNVGNRTPTVCVTLPHLPHPTKGFMMEPFPHLSLVMLSSSFPGALVMKASMFSECSPLDVMGMLM